MSTTNDGGLIRFECDGIETCLANVEYDAQEMTFADAWAAARDEGWVNAEERGVWHHYCPKCAKHMGID